MPVPPDDQMIVHRDVEGLGDLDDVARQPYVGGGRGRIAGRVVVRHV